MDSLYKDRIYDQLSIVLDDKFPEDIWKKYDELEHIYNLFDKREVSNRKKILFYHIRLLESFNI